MEAIQRCGVRCSTKMYEGTKSVSGDGKRKKVMKLKKTLVLYALFIFAHCFSSVQPDGSLVFDDIQQSIDDDSGMTRGSIQFTDANSTFTVVGVFLSDNNANVLCGSLVVNDVSLLYDTPAYHANPTVSSLFQRDSQHPNAIALQNKVTSFFIGKWYSVQRLLDGTANAWTFNNHCVYHKGNTGVSGFVRLGGGFTILPDASTAFDTFITANGGIDLRETGTLVLAGALGFGSSVTMSSGGNIDGQGNQLVLGGNLTLPSNKIFHIMSDTIINGLGNTLTVGDYGQLLVDNSITLTLQNMTLVSGAKTAVLPPIRCAGSKSKLVLDSVTFSPGADIPFYQGQLFTYNAVHFTGTSALVYSSPQSSFIMPSSSLYFDTSTTFSFAPATASKSQIIMSNATSSLVLNGCTLKVTDTGLQLTKGTLTYQGSVTLDTKNGYSLSSLITATSGYFVGSYVSAGAAMKVRWHPCGRYFACTGDNGSGYAKVYSFNPETNATALVSSVSYGGASYFPYAIDWSPDGRYLALGGAVAAQTPSPLYIFSFNGTTLTQIASITLSYWTCSLAWSPDGRYLAVGGTSTGSSFEVFKFNGVGLTLVATYAANASIPYVAWNPGGRYLAFADNTNLRIYVVSFNGASLSYVTNSQFGSAAYSVDWSSDGNYLTAGAGDGSVVMYAFNGSGLSLYTPPIFVAGARAVKWAPDYKMLAVCGDASVIKMYVFNTAVVIPYMAYLLSPAPTSIMDCHWHPTGNYLAAIGKDATNYYYYILSVAYVPPTIQAQTNSIVYGNSGLGSSANLAVSGSYTTLRGTVLNQNV